MLVNAPRPVVDAVLRAIEPGWDFWSATRVPLDDLRNEYGVRPAAADLRP